MTEEELARYLRIEKMTPEEQESLLFMLEELIAERIYASVAQMVAGRENEEEIAAVLNPQLAQRVASSVIEEFRAAV
ncbi:MAG TPA: hypothetical protein VEB60_01820 [Candidatus Paceibacterota bacterium]|nr:hypothetical protein [Candidatus Paceibacterota bacterium]